MTQESFQDLVERFRSEDTHELIALMKRAAEMGKDDSVLGALRHVLEGRQARFPDTGKPSTPSAKPGEKRPLAIESNASVCGLGADKLEIHFPRGGFLRCERSAFRDKRELASYLGEVFYLPDERSALRLSVKRKGKYRRIDRTGKTVFTFGDPIVDMITDEHGWVSIGNETYNLIPFELASPQVRGGGITSIDLTPHHEEERRQQLAEAFSVNGTRTLVECSADQTILATTNPSRLDFWSGTDHMVFRSWKKNYGVYRSMGTEIDVRSGPDFSRASIQSRYADPVVPTHPFICGIVKVDSDSDTNDDYVDEYEYAILASLPSTVGSYCEARWKGQLYSGTVSKGDCQIIVV